MLTTDNLVGYLRAQYGRSARLRIWQFCLQLAIAVPAAVSVVVTSETGLYVLAIIGAGLLVAWWAINLLYVSARVAAHAARRAALLSGGVAEPLSPVTTAALQDRLKMSSETAKKYEQADYYATNLPTGPAKLAEMVEESAFFSAALQRASATAMLAILGVFTVLSVGVALATLPFVGHGTALTVIRILLSVFVFAMSSDVLGAYILHKNAARAIEDVRTRLAAVSSINCPLPDVLLAMGDYNEAIESAPEIVPLAYKFKEADLTARWNEYRLNREAALTAKSVAQ